MNPTRESPFVSVVIPCYNHARFLGEAIESVLAQTHQQFEIVVVDDGSSDSTVDVARGYAGVRCVSQRNQGQGVARNEGLRHIAGEFVVFLDADDRLLPHAIDVGLRCLAAHPEVAFVAGRYAGLGPDGIQRPFRHDPVVERDHYLRLLTNNYICMLATVMFRTAVVRHVGGFKFRAAEDYDLYLRIARNHRIWCHDQVVAEYRQHDNQTTGNYPLMLSSTVRVLRGQRAAVRGDPRAEQALREGIRRWQDAYGEQLMNVVRKQLRAREFRRAIPALVGFLRCHPTGFLHHACRKLSRVALGRKPETPDAIGFGD